MYSCYPWLGLYGHYLMNNVIKQDDRVHRRKHE